MDERTMALIVHGDDLRPSIDRFKVEAYQPILRPVIEASTRKGMSGDVGAYTLRSFVMAGRIMLTFEWDDGAKSVTILGADGEADPRFGLHSLNATVFDARDAIETATSLYKRWPDDYSRRFKDDDDTILDVLAGV